MKQLTEKEAIKFAESKAWKDLSDKELVGFQLFQKKLCMPFSIFHEAIEKVLARPVYTHEFGLNYDGLVAEYLGKAPKPNLEDIINLIPKEKRIIFVTPKEDHTVIKEE